MNCPGRKTNYRRPSRFEHRASAFAGPANLSIACFVEARGELAIRASAGLNGGKHILTDCADPRSHGFVPLKPQGARDVPQTFLL